MNWELFTAFLLITVVLIVVPGPIVTFIIATGASRGIRAALTVVAGTALGTAILLAAIACGLSWIIKNAAVLFEILRWAGAVYLIWLGVQAWQNAGADRFVETAARVHFWRGFTVALFNPKTMAFFTAFLPQFVDPALPAERQLAVMCLVALVVAALSDSAWAMSAGLGRAWFLTSSRARVLGRLSGIALIGGGIWLSLARRPA
jgi:homoserine/homoserine lactone efflux protein